MRRYLIALAFSLAVFALAISPSPHAGAKPGSFKRTPKLLAAPPVGETTAFSKKLADAVNKAPASADADLAILRVTSRKQGGKTILTAVIQCEVLRSFAGTRQLTLTRRFLRAPTNPEAVANTGPIPFVQTLKSFTLTKLRPGEIALFDVDLTGFEGEIITITLSPGDRNPANDVKRVRAPRG